jgi:hypothetical protein
LYWSVPSTGDNSGGESGVVVAPTVTINPIDGDNVINHAQANAIGGVAVSGTVAGLTSGSTLTVSVTDGTFSNGYDAIVGANGAWTATIPSSDATLLANGVATVSVFAATSSGDSNVASESVTVAEGDDRSGRRKQRHRQF